MRPIRICYRHIKQDLAPVNGEGVAESDFYFDIDVSSVVLILVRILIYRGDIMTGIILGLFKFALLITGISLLVKGIYVKTTYRVTSGTVREIKSNFSSSSEHLTYTQTVEYRVDGVDYITNNILPKSNTSVGDTVTVRYSKNNPKKVRDIFLLFFMGSMCTFFGVALTVVMCLVNFSELF